MRPLGACGRADLVRALWQGDPVMAQITAELLGFDAVPKPPMSIMSTAPSPLANTHDDADGQEPAAEPEAPAQPLADIPFWYVAAYETLASAETAEQAVEPGEIEWTNRPTEPPRIPLLAPWREVQARLRCEAAQWHETRALDVPAVVATLTRGRQLGRIPYERRRRWGPRLQIIADRSDRLIPYWADQEATGHALGKLLASHQIERAAIWEGLSAPRLLTEGSGVGDYRLPPPGSLVLVLGDLGCLADGDGELQQFWLGFGRSVADAGCHPAALLPCPPQRCAQALRDLWRVLPWARSPGAVVTDPEQRRQRAERLLCLVSPALRIEPGLLRAVRLLLPADEADSGTESEVWQHPALSSDSAAAATLAPDKAKEYRAEFAQQPTELQTQVLALLRLWRGGLPKEIWFEEIQSLAAVSRTLLPAAHKDKDLELARRFFVQFSQRARGLAAGGIASGALAWYRRCERRLTSAAYADADVGKALNRLSATLHKQEDFKPDRSFLPSDAPPDRIRRLLLSQVMDQLQCIEQTDPRVLPTVGSPLGTVESGNGWVKIEPQTDSVFETESVSDEFWETGEPPSWASDWGRDEYGAWVEFSVEGEVKARYDGSWKYDGSINFSGKNTIRVTQRMRWIEPGTFMMGSPKTEAERYDDEGPQHEVNLQQGYWLFDTACTQALWQAVMGKNPSHFKDDNKPIENVSWNDAQQFIQALNQRLPGLDLSLPSEAQWEYACRAGTETPFSFGGNITPEQVNYDGNNPYAGGEKGKFRKETVPVKSLPANPWGLFEMHGNVREWVQDAWHGNYQGAPTDGSVWESADAGAARVVRGGSWFFSARYCRSAARRHDSTGLRFNSIGFRCARVQGRESGQQAAGRPRQTRSGASQSALARSAAPDDRSHAPRGNAAEGAPRLGPQSGQTDVPTQSVGTMAPTQSVGTMTTLLRLDTAPKETTPLPQAKTFAILTDRERLVVRQTQQPEWAETIGRDRFGLWADIAVESKQGELVIQRLRWIPPGRFMMGSPEGEPGRWEAEGPQHLVTIAQGYWLFDTPCTQALWEAVMGDNPSYFKSPLRPVEKVSWDDIQQRFLSALNERIPGFMLPSEAQWEYACRAGTNTALYTGPIEIIGERNAPALDGIAWYGGNSGVGFDLPEGYDSSDWKKMQYPNPKSGTREVGQKHPNHWGLYDMLGNVWEWVEDPWHPNYELAPIDGSLWQSADAGAARVLRGGSWRGHARFCRSASRDRVSTDDRDYDAGFRCARVQS